MGKHQTGGAVRKCTAKIKYFKIKINVFDIREDFSLNIQNMRKIHLLGFSIQRLWEKSLEISRRGRGGEGGGGGEWRSISLLFENSIVLIKCTLYDTVFQR